MMDTAAKRFSAQLTSLPFRGVATPPDNATSPGDRFALAYQYSGLVTVTIPSAVCIYVGSATITAPKATSQIATANATGYFKCM
jgi:hypothetical protein